jgi:predicted phage tail protein
MPMVTVVLKDELADRFISEIRLNVGSVKEAIRALESAFPTFRNYMVVAHERGVGFQITVGDWAIEQQHVSMPTGKQTITIAPTPLGGGGAFGKILLGIGLVVLGATGVGFLGLSAASVALIGGSLALSGIMELFNQPKAPDPNDAKNKPSLIFNGGVNTTTQGGRLPVVYGELLVGSQVLSASIRSYMIEDDSDDEG